MRNSLLLMVFSFMSLKAHATSSRTVGSDLESVKFSFACTSSFGISGVEWNLDEIKVDFGDEKNSRLNPPPLLAETRIRTVESDYAGRALPEISLPGVWPTMSGSSIPFQASTYVATWAEEDVQIRIYCQGNSRCVGSTDIKGVDIPLLHCVRK
jgi:hypothetical protein